MSGFKSFPLCPSRCVSPMLLAPEAWGEVSQAQAPMGRPVTQHALLLLQCMLVLRPGSVVSRRGPVLLPESPCYKTEHPLIPHSGMYSEKHAYMHTKRVFFLFSPFSFLFPFIIAWTCLLYAIIYVISHYINFPFSFHSFNLCLITQFLPSASASYL